MHFDRPVWREAIDWLAGRPRLAAVCLSVILLPAIASAAIFAIKIGMINYTSLKNTILIDAAAQIAGLFSTSFAQLMIIISVHWAIVLKSEFFHCLCRMAAGVSISVALAGDLAPRRFPWRLMQCRCKNIRAGQGKLLLDVGPDWSLRYCADSALGHLAARFRSWWKPDARGSKDQE